MRKSILFLFALLPLRVLGQSITLEPSGFINVEDSTKNYVVLEFPNISKDALYKKSLTYLNTIYKNPNTVLSYVEGESVIINGSTSAIAGTSNMYKYLFSYSILMQFKDGKVRFEPRFNRLQEDFMGRVISNVYLLDKHSSVKGEVNCIYITNSKNQVILFKKELKNSIDDWGNTYVKNLKAALSDEW